LRKYCCYMSIYIHKLFMIY